MAPLLAELGPALRARLDAVAVAVALVSSLQDVKLPASLVVFGEIGLTGEVRPVNFGEERIREAAKQGFTTAIVPRDNLPRGPIAGIDCRPVGRVDEALRLALARTAL
jgi:DNA repair protein RadA/Sms